MAPLNLDDLVPARSEREGDRVGEGADWWVEQRYRAVLEVRDVAPVAEVADRYGVCPARRCTAGGVGSPRPRGG